MTALHSLQGQHLGTLLAARAAARGAHPYIVFDPPEGEVVCIGHAEFEAMARRMAHGLQRRGVRPGERVMLHLDNCAEFLVAWCGCGLAGAIAVTTNTRNADDELRYVVNHCEPVAAITQARHAQQVGRCAPALKWIVLTDAAAGRDDAWANLLAHTPSSGPLADVRGDTPMAIQYTSGTTSRPKAVLWTHANALWAGSVSAAHQMLRPDDVHACVLPLFHTNALSYSSLAALWAGATVVLQEKFSTSRYWEVALRHRCTWSSMTLFCWRALLQVETPRDHSFRYWGTAATEPLIERHFGIPTISWWGMSETLTQGIVSSPVIPARPGTIGRPANEYGVRIVDDTGREIEPGETGLMEIKGTPGVSLFAGYFRDEQATRDAYTDDRWFRTGDAIALEPDGLLRFADRAKDMLKVGGENVATMEIERVVVGVEGIDEAVVLGRPHAMYNEVPVVFVRLRPDAPARARDHWRDAVLTRCQRDLAPFKVPREVHVLDDFPRTSIGKVSKAALRAEWLPRWSTHTEGALA